MSPHTHALRLHCPASFRPALSRGARRPARRRGRRAPRRKKICPDAETAEKSTAKNLQDRSCPAHLASRNLTEAHKFTKIAPSQTKTRSLEIAGLLLRYLKGARIVRALRAKPRTDLPALPVCSVTAVHRSRFSSPPLTEPDWRNIPAPRFDEMFWTLQVLRPV